MDEEIKQEFDFMRHAMDGSFKTIVKEILDLKEQVGINCKKLDNFEVKLNEIKEHTDILPQMFELVQANGQGIEDLSGRLDKIELQNK